MIPAGHRRRKPSAADGAVPPGPRHAAAPPRLGRAASSHYGQPLVPRRRGGRPRGAHAPACPHRMGRRRHLLPG
jgi:hypothetical protein